MEPQLLHIGIGILSCNRLQTLERLITSIGQHLDFTWASIHLLVGDDSGESDPCRGWLRTQSFQTAFNTPPRGIAGNTNVLLSRMEGLDFIFLLNDDMEAKGDFVKFYVQGMLKSGFHHLCFLSKKYFRPTTHWKKQVKSLTVNAVPMELKVDKPQGALLVLDRLAFETAGYFDEVNLPFYGFEHIDWSNRVRMSGIQAADGFYDLAEAGQYIDLQFPIIKSRDAGRRRQKIQNERKYLQLSADRKRIRIEKPKT